MRRLQISSAQFESRRGYERSVVFGPDDFNADTKLQLVRLAPSQRIEPHYHKVRTECFKIISGDGEIRVNGEAVATSGNDIILCNPGDVHEFINHSMTEPLIVLVVRTNDPGSSDIIWEES